MVLRFSPGLRQYNFNAYVGLPVIEITQDIIYSPTLLASQRYAGALTEYGVNQIFLDKDKIKASI